MPEHADAYVSQRGSSPCESSQPTITEATPACIALPSICIACDGYLRPHSARVRGDLSRSPMQRHASGTDMYRCGPVSHHWSCTLAVRVGRMVPCTMALARASSGIASLAVLCLFRHSRTLDPALAMTMTPWWSSRSRPHSLKNRSGPSPRLASGVARTGFSAAPWISSRKDLGSSPGAGGMSMDSSSGQSCALLRMERRIDSACAGRSAAASAQNLGRWNSRIGMATPAWMTVRPCGGFRAFIMMDHVLSVVKASVRKMTRCWSARWAASCRIRDVAAAADGDQRGAYLSSWPSGRGFAL